MTGEMSDEERIFLRRVADMVELSERRYTPRYTNFLTEREQAIAQAELHGCPHAFFGGYENAKRKLLAVDANGGELLEADSPLVAVTFTFRKEDKLSHRDFLGAFMALGIKRELLGDILVGEGCAIVFAVTQIKQLLLEEVTKAGRVGVSAAEGITAELPQEKFREIKGVVSSIRLDSIVAASTNLSREKAADIIKSGNVQLAYRECTSVSSEVPINTDFSVRGFGKFRLTEIGSVTQKGRYHIIISKYE